MERLQFSTRGTSYFPFGLQISAQAWGRYRVSHLLAQNSATEGQSPVVILRHLTDRLNELRASGTAGMPPARASELLLAGT
ncbi:MAG: hypothetical protein RBU21_19550, partial [FCB group bacterium]|nr:hypothetical protein [FCB group bacterium]